MNEEFASQLVLVVDDTPDNCESYQELLQGPLGCRVEVADCQERALERLERGPAPALVLLDVCLPEPRHGYEVCRAIKKGGLQPEVQVVMITANADAPVVLQGCLDAGADDFLRKEATREEILLRVRSKLQAQARYVELLKLRQREIVTEFAKAVQHDVGNSLVGIQGHAEMAVAVAGESVEFITQMLRVLSELADAGGEEKPSVFPVRKLLVDTLVMVKYRSLPSVVVDECPAGLDATVSAFRPNLLFTLAELVLNAATIIKQDRADSGRLQDGRIVLSAEQFEDEGAPWVRITVADNGPGVPASILGTLFDEGVTLRPRGGGTGRGLYIARNRIERAGGRIWHEPNRPRGARIIIELPEARG